MAVFIILKWNQPPKFQYESMSADKIRLGRFCNVYRTTPQVTLGLAHVMNDWYLKRLHLYQLVIN